MCVIDTEVGSQKYFSLYLLCLLLTFHSSFFFPFLVYVSSSSACYIIPPLLCADTFQRQLYFLGCLFSQLYMHIGIQDLFEPCLFLMKVEELCFMVYIWCANTFQNKQDSVKGQQVYITSKSNFSH